MRVKQPKPEPAVIRGLLAVRRDGWPIGVIESALEEAIESVDCSIRSLTQPCEPYDRYDWQRMQDFYNRLEAYKQCLKLLRPARRKGRK